MSWSVWRKIHFPWAENSNLVQPSLLSLELIRPGLRNRKMSSMVGPRIVALVCRLQKPKNPTPICHFISYFIFHFSTTTAIYIQMIFETTTDRALGKGNGILSFQLNELRTKQTSPIFHMTQKSRELTCPCHSMKGYMYLYPTKFYRLYTSEFSYSS
jgi:hypothetical protein